MHEWPTLYTGAMIRAQLAGVKTQTRRPLYVLTKKLHSVCYDERYEPPLALPPVGYAWTLSRWHRAAPGDLIWARENCWQRPERTPKMMREGADTWAPFYYDADGITEQEAADFKAWGFKRRPSIHMPRAACRIQRVITENRVERLQAISEADALAEGVMTWREGWDERMAATMFLWGTKARIETRDGGVAQRLYYLLWDAINGASCGLSWTENPWVCAISFSHVEKLGAGGNAK